MKASEVVNNFKKQKKDRSFEKPTEWPKCYHTGCPLTASIKAEVSTCTYHYGEQGASAQAVSKAVGECASYLAKYADMQTWDVKAWGRKAPHIMGWPVLPATEDEMKLPSLYLTRFRSWIDAKIKARASEIYNN